MLDLLPPMATILPHSIGPYIAVMLSGFAIGIIGHASRSKWLIASGCVLIFLGAFLLPLALTLSTETPQRVENSPSP